MTSRDSLRQEAENALNDKDWAAGELVVPEPSRKVSVVHSTRLPAEYSNALEAEAVRRGISPSRLMQLLVIAGLERETAGDVVTISRSKLHEAIDRIVTSAA